MIERVEAPLVASPSSEERLLPQTNPTHTLEPFLSPTKLVVFPAVFANEVNKGGKAVRLGSLGTLSSHSLDPPVVHTHIVSCGMSIATYEQNYKRLFHHFWLNEFICHCSNHFTKSAFEAGFGLASINPSHKTKMEEGVGWEEMVWLRWRNWSNHTHSDNLTS